MPMLPSNDPPSPAASSTSAGIIVGEQISSLPSSPPDTASGLAQDLIHDHEASSRSIAIIGMGCRVPGGINSPAALWDYLMAKGDASGEIPPARWQPYRERSARCAEILENTTARGYFLDRLEDFDASFFGVAPREAEQMDPQQRIALEVAWEALEDAGIAPQQLSGTDAAVYMGVNSDDYGKLVLEDLEGIGAHMGVGTAYCGVPSRISYLLNLMGPSVAVDAACASSLVAVHQARQALLAGETELALAGGVNALVGPGLTRVLDEAGALSADGKCRSFDDSASGYGRGEGAGVVVLKRLDRALADGDRIHGVLKGSAVCADGKTVGIMAPNGVAQRLVARKALNEAKTPPQTISYIEAHATSTPLGDPTETEALSQVYGRGVRQTGSEPCPVGSLKPNIGHLEAGAGVMGLIKAVMVLQHGVVPGQVNLEKPSTKIDWLESGLKVSSEVIKLACGSSTPARAAIASYGYSGTVSHAIIEASPACVPGSQPLATDPMADESPVLLLLSAPEQHRLPQVAASLARWLESGPGTAAPLQHVATTLASRRGHHKFRASVAAGDKRDAIHALDRLAKGAAEDDPFITNGRVTPGGTGQSQVWIFSGHGAQWPAMGRELYETQPRFARVIRELEPIAQKELGFSVTAALLSGRTDHTTDVVQTMTFAMHMGIAAILLDEAGPPSAIVGHSLGETAASVVAGAITFREGSFIVCKRARLYRDIMGRGAMALVAVGAEEMRSRLGTKGPGHVEVAIDASPGSCVVAGPSESVTELSKELAMMGVQVRAVRSEVPFHSSMLLELADPLRRCLDGLISPQPAKIRLYSTSDPDARSANARGVEYWISNMVRPVLLRQAVEDIAEDGHREFVEVSSHPIISHSVHETLHEAGFTDSVVLPTMVRDKPAMKHILASIGRLHCLGLPLRCVEPNARPWLPETPRTIWSHRPHWRTVTKAPAGPASAHIPSHNHLLGARTTLWGTESVVFQTQLDRSSRPYPGSHPLHGSEVVPAAVLINTFSADYLASVGVPEMGFPWKVTEHMASDDEMLARVEVNPENSAGVKDPLASAMDAATSIASTLFYQEPLLRMPTTIARVIARGNTAELSEAYIYCRITSKSSCAADILVCSRGGEVIVELRAMAFAGIENNNLSRRTTNGLIHQVSWTPAVLAEMPLQFRHVLFLLTETTWTDMKSFEDQLQSRGYTTSWTTNPKDTAGLDGDHIVIHIPQMASSKLEVFDAAARSCESLIAAAQIISASRAKAKLVSLTTQGDATSLARLVSGSLYGLARIMKTELPEIWGGLFDIDNGTFPLTAIKYVRGHDVVRQDDDVPRTARLRPFTDAATGESRAEGHGMKFRPGGTYLITGGLGALGLEVASWMVSRGARRLLLVSRRQLPPRSAWRDTHGIDCEILKRILEMEMLGATVHVISVDISAPDADTSLSEAIERLSLPPVTGIVHGAGILKDQLVEDITQDAFATVLAPKITGALHLDKLFPPRTLDFFVLFSSCGQLLGFPGQASYASANSFLDALADHRRRQGDNSQALLWTSWRGLGMAASTECVSAELEARGISDITRDEAFMAWDRAASLDTSQAVVLRALPLDDDDEDPPHPILQDISPRRPAPATRGVSGQSTAGSGTMCPSRPASGPALEQYISEALRSAAAATLGTGDEDIDASSALSELGMDSVMTVQFRTKVQRSLRVQMAPTLLWKCPTLAHLVKHFMMELEA
ncbi:hypothetical protein INS49_000084 [Diaporthe citri]|uniref:uncharacterized protein n=1 Tax=Diaporthe citri TaxID=83186 RepID=UPI001C803615|nr:uncharacterized protein INS49_000084 [Diaporthe citri]KAG6365908.1 hypothetical protein INS49_000084 [Diaporthe citri]